VFLFLKKGHVVNER